MSFDPRVLLRDPLALLTHLVRDSVSLRQMLVRLILISAGCAAPVESQELPANEVVVPSLVGYSFTPDAPEPPKPPTPPVNWMRAQLVGHPDHARWAFTDGANLWLGEGTLLQAVERDHHVAVTAMTMDGDGALWVIEDDDRLRRVDEQGRSHDLGRLPVEDASGIWSGAGRVVVAGTLPSDAAAPPDERIDASYERGYDEFTDTHAVLAIGEDGRAWTLRRRPQDTSEFDDLAIASDGAVQLMDGVELDCGGGGQDRWLGHLDRPGWTALTWAHDAPYDRSAAPGGWTYAYTDCQRREGDSWVAVSDGHVLCAIDAAGDGNAILELDDEYPFVAMAHAGAVSMFLAEDGLWALDEARATRLGDGLANMRSLSTMAVSADGVVVAHEHELRVGTPKGWITVASPR